MKKAYFWPNLQSNLTLLFLTQQNLTQRKLRLGEVRLDYVRKNIDRFQGLGFSDSGLRPEINLSHFLRMFSVLAFFESMKELDTIAANWPCIRSQRHIINMVCLNRRIFAFLELWKSLTWWGQTDLRLVFSDCRNILLRKPLPFF